MFNRRHVLMNAAVEDGGPGTGGADGAATALANAGTETDYDYIPEKYRASGEDGSIDLAASSRRLAEAHTALEARLGSGDARPKTVDEYTITVPDALKDAFDPATDEGFKTFLQGAHEAGLSQKQLEFVMNRYFEVAPQLVQGAQQHDMDTTTEALGKVWTDPADMKKNMGAAYTATTALANRAGVELESIVSGPLGNNPDFIRLMAAIGPELQEDPGVSNASGMPSADREALMKSEAYRDPKHPEYKAVHERVRRSYEKEFGTAAVI